MIVSFIISLLKIPYVVLKCTTDHNFISESSMKRETVNVRPDVSDWTAIAVV